MKTAERFCEVGALLYGDVWQAQLSRDLGIDQRRLAQWKAGVRPIPAGVWVDLKLVATRREGEVNAALLLL